MKPASRKRTALLREAAFATAFVSLGFRVREAAIAAGVPALGAATWGSLALRKPNVQELVQQHVAAFVERHDLSLDKVVMEIKKSAFSNMRNYVRLDAEGNVIIDLTNAMSEDSGDMMAAVQSIRTDEKVLMRGEDKTIISRRTQIKLYDRNEANDKLMRFLGGYVGKEAPSQTNNYFGDVDARTQVVNIAELSPDEAAKAYQKLLKG